MTETATAPPNDVHAEESVLAAMLLSPAAIEAAAEVLEPESARKFYRASFGRLFERMLAMHRAGLPVDAITVRDSITKQPIEDMTVERLHELAVLAPAAGNVSHYAGVVRRLWVRRSILKIGTELQRRAMEGEGENDSIFQEAQEMFDSARGALERERDVVMTMYEAAAYLDEKFKNPPEVDGGVPTPFRFLPPMKGGRLYVLAAYEKDGKSSIAPQFFRRAIEAKVPSGYVTLEMSAVDMAERLASNMGLNAKQVERGRFNDQVNRDKAFRIVGQMAMMADGGRIFDAPACTAADLRRYVKTYGLKFLVIDHLHQFSIRAEYQREDIETIVREIHVIAREFDIPVLLLAQLSRTGDKKNPFPRPTAAQLRGSGMIEKLAWTVWFVWRERDEANLAQDATEFIIALNRSGATGMRRIRFVPHETRFEEIAHEG